MKLSVIVVNWNTADLLWQCLESIYTDLPAVEAEVFVVDSASTDHSMAEAQARYPQAVYLVSPVNVGFGTANNLALRQVQGDFLLLLNPDTLVHPGAIDALLAYMEKHPHVGASASRLLNTDGSLQYSCSPEPTLGREFLRMFHLGGVRPDGYYPMETWDVTTSQPVDVILGACMLLRKTALDQVGLFDERFFMYSEEVDLSRRIRQAGWEIHWVPQSLVTHHGGQSTRQMAAEMFVQLYRAKIDYFRKHHGTLQAAIYKLILFASGLPRLALAPVARLEPAPRREEHRAIADNYYRLLRALPGL